MLARPLAHPPAPIVPSGTPARWVHGGGGRATHATLDWRPPPTGCSGCICTCCTTQSGGGFVLLASLLITDPCRPRFKLRRGGQPTGRPCVLGGAGYGWRGAKLRRVAAASLHGKPHSAARRREARVVNQLAAGWRACIGADRQSQHLRRRPRLPTAVNTTRVGTKTARECTHI